MRRYDVVENSDIIREIADTNFEGEVQFQIEQNAELYSFVVEFGGETRKITARTIIFGNTLTLPILITPIIGASFSNTFSIDHNLSFNTVTNTFNFIYNDQANLLSETCLRVRARTNITTSLFNESCSSASSGTISIIVLPTNGTTYIGQAFFGFSPTNSWVDQVIVSFAEANPITNIGVLMILILTIAFAFIWRWSQELSAIMTPLPIVMGAYMGLLLIPLWVANSLLLLGIITAIIISRA